MKLTGKLDFWSPRKFGFIIVKEPDGLLKKYFLLYRNIKLCEPDLPYADCLVTFDVSTSLPPSDPRKFPLALNAEIRHPLMVAGGVALSKPIEGGAR